MALLHTCLLTLCHLHESVVIVAFTNVLVFGVVVFRRLLGRNRSRRCRDAAWAAREARAQANARATAAAARAAARVRTHAPPAACEAAPAPHASACAISRGGF